jgi:hypothetical protein
VLLRQHLKEGFTRSETAPLPRLRTIALTRVARSADEVVHAQVNTPVVPVGVRDEVREGTGGTAAGGTLWKDECETVLSQAPGMPSEFLLFPGSLRQETE